MWIALSILALLLATNWGSLFAPPLKRPKNYPESPDPVQIRVRTQFLLGGDKVAWRTWGYRFRPLPGKQDPDALPIVVIPGGVANLLALEEFIVELVRAGREVVVADAPNSGAEAHLRVIRHYNISKADFVTHSAGNLFAVGIAETLETSGKPQIAETVVMVAPSGTIRGDGLMALGKRFLDDSIPQENRLHRERKLQSWWPPDMINRGPVYYFFLSFWETMWEARKIARADIVPGIRFMRAKGIRVVVVAEANDRVYPLKMVRAALEGQVDEFVVDGEGIHQSLPLQSTRTAKLVLASMAKLEAKTE